MIKRILFILVLCLLIVSPAFAWTNLTTTTTTGNDWSNGAIWQKLVPIKIWMRHIENLGDVTKVEADFSLTSAYAEGGNHAEVYSASGNVKCGVTTVGTYSASWNHPGAEWNTYASGMYTDIELAITDDTACGTGSGTYTLEGTGSGWAGSTNSLVYSRGATTVPNNGNYDTCVYTHNSNCALGSFAVFSGAGTPPSTNRTITVHVSNLAHADLEDVYVEASNGDLSYSNAGLTDATGHVIFTNFTVLDDDQTVYFHIPATGIYEAYTEDFEITADTEVEAVMVSASPSGTYRNITYYVQAYDNTPLSGIWVNHIVNSNFELGDFTNSTGYVRFLNVPVVNNGAYYEANIYSPNTLFQSSSGYFAFTGDMSKTITLYPTSMVVTPTPTLPAGQTPTPTVTPTPIPQYALYLSAYPDSINLGSSVTLTGSSSNSTALTYAGGLRRTSFYVNKHAQQYPYDFNMIGQFENVNATYWKFRANVGQNWNTASTASPLSMVDTPDTNGIYTYSFNAYDTTGNAISQAGTDIVNVGGGAGSGSLTIKIGAYDATTNAQLMNFQLNLSDEGTGVITEYGDIVYDKEINLPRGNGYVARVTKSGYQTSTVIGETGTLLFVVPTNLNIQKGDFGAYFRVPLFPDGSVIAGNTSISSRVYDIETYYPLANVQVTNSNAPTDIKFTGNDAESVSWVIPHNTAFSLTAVKTGYCTVTESRNTATESSMWIPLYMKYGSCSGSTTPTPTPTITPTATATPIGGWGNLTGGAIVCGNMPENATIIDVMKNGLACNGLRDEQSQNLGIAMLIILFAAIILGRIAKGVGVLAGVIAGTVLSTVAGFLPFWIIIVVIIIAGLVFAGKVFWSSGN